MVSRSQPPRHVKPVRGSSSPPTQEPKDWTEGGEGSEVKLDTHLYSDQLTVFLSS